MSKIERNPIVKRFFLGIAPEKIMEVYTISKNEIAKQVHEYCKTANPDLYKILCGPDKRPTMRDLQKMNSEF